jgi:hypothetical protein
MADQMRRAACGLGVGLFGEMQVLVETGTPAGSGRRPVEPGTLVVRSVCASGDAAPALQKVDADYVFLGVPCDEPR